jgi:hypothetical protein
LPSKIEIELIFSYLPMATLIIAFRDKNEEKNARSQFENIYLITTDKL